MGLTPVPDRFLALAAARPWAIHPPKAREIVEFFEMRREGVLQSDADIAAVTSRRRAEQPASGGGVAVIPLMGVIAHRADNFDESSGAVSLERFWDNVSAALSNDEIGTIVFQVDSPGGSVDGVPEAAAKLFAVRGTKRMIAVADPLVASAAYWLMSQCDEVVATPSGMLGSIGVIAVHTEWSKYAAALGLTTTVFTAGEGKGEGNPHEPLTESATAHIDQTINDYYDQFVAAVAQGRGMPEEEIRKTPTGRAFTAHRAVEMGLADRVATIDDVLAELGVRRRAPGARADLSAPQIGALEPMNAIAAAGAVATAQRLAPEPTGPKAQEIAMPEGTTAGLQDGAQNADVLAVERKRVQSINDVCDLHAGLVTAEKRREWIAAGSSVESVMGEIVTAQRQQARPIVEPARAEAPAVIRSRVSRANDDKPGIGFARFALALANGRGGRGDSIAWAEEHYPDVAAAMRSSSFSAGGALVPENYIPEVIELLRPQSAVRKLNPMMLPMPNGTASISKLTGGATAGYVGEARRATKSEATTGRLNLSSKKLVAYVPISNDLIRRSNPQADLVVRDDSVSALAMRSDLAFIRGDGTENTPKGLRYWAPSANVIPANGTVNLANVTNDLGEAVLALQAADVRMLRPGWIFAPRTQHYLMTVRDGNGNYAFRTEMLTGLLWGYPFASTSQIPVNLGGGGDESEVYFADFADVVIGEEENLRVDIHDQATYYDGTEWVSASQNDEVVLRLIAEHDFGMRHDESVAVITEVTWGA